MINGVSNNDYSGFSVSSAGDVDGDCFADLIVGVFGDIPHDGESGASFVIFGAQGTSANVGTTEADILTGDATADQSVGGQDDDILTGNGGADVLRGGEGDDDVLGISDFTFASLDCGTSIDTLRLSGNGITLDLTQVGNNLIVSIKKIDLTDSGDNSLILTTAEVNNLVGANSFQTSGANAGRRMLLVDGNAGDVVTFNDSDWGQGTDVTFDSMLYHLYIIIEKLRHKTVVYLFDVPSSDCLYKSALLRFYLRRV